MALAKLLQHAIEHNDSRLQEIEVKGDQIFCPTDGIRTRSKAAKGSTIKPYYLVIGNGKIYHITAKIFFLYLIFHAVQTYFSLIEIWKEK